MFVILDKNKHRTRDSYIIVNVQENTVEIVKTKRGKTSRKYYVVKKENIYKARHFVQNQQGYQEHEEEKGDTKSSQECFFCKKCKYINFHHDKNDCVRLKNVKARMKGMKKGQLVYYLYHTLQKVS